jgi:hypothetical protein
MGGSDTGFRAWHQAGHSIITSALGSRVIPLLSQALAEDKSVAVRRLAAEASGRLGERQSIPALRCFTRDAP